MEACTEEHKYFGGGKTLKVNLVQTIVADMASGFVFGIVPVGEDYERFNSLLMQNLKRLLAFEITAGEMKGDKYRVGGQLFFMDDDDEEKVIDWEIYNTSRMKGGVNYTKAE